MPKRNGFRAWRHERHAKKEAGQWQRYHEWLDGYQEWLADQPLEDEDGVAIDYGEPFTFEEFRQFEKDMLFFKIATGVVVGVALVGAAVKGKARREFADFAGADPSSPYGEAREHRLGGLRQGPPVQGVAEEQRRHRPRLPGHSLGQSGQVHLADQVS